MALFGAVSALVERRVIEQVLSGESSDRFTRQEVLCGCGGSRVFVLDGRQARVRDQNKVDLPLGK